jgi:tetratricopeptide (TPR) repeat protein
MPEWSLIVSSVAVTVSLTSAAVTLFQKRSETLRVVRQQITDALAKILALAYQQAELTMDPTADQTNPQHQAKLGYIFRQHTFYSRHAIFLMQRAPNIVSDADYIALAESFQQVGDYVEANANYLKAISKSRNPFYRGVNIRMAAEARYHQGDCGGGASLYEDALKLTMGSGDQTLAARGYTYQSWARSEATYNDKAAAATLFGKARDTYNRVQAANIRTFNLSGLAYDLRRFYGDGAPGVASAADSMPSDGQVSD